MFWRRRLVSSNLILTGLFVGIAQFCNPLTQKDANTVKFCQDRSTSGSTIFIISGAQRHEQVHSCTCELSISEEIKNITLAYNAGNTEDNCGVEIDIDDKTGGFSCISGDLVVQTIKSVEFSRTTTEETNLCLEISLGGYNLYVDSNFSIFKIAHVCRIFLHTRPEFPWIRPGLGNVVLHEGCKMTLVHNVSMTILTSFWLLNVIFDVLTSLSPQFPPNISTSTYKTGAVPNFSWLKNVVTLA